MLNATSSADRRPAKRRIALRTPSLIVAAIALAVTLGSFAYATRSLGASLRSATPAFHRLTLLNGWASENGDDGTGNPSVALRDGIVYLSGSLAQPSGSSLEFAVLPPAYRPVHNMTIVVYTSSGSTGGLEISDSGVMTVASATSLSCPTEKNAAQCFTSLAAISFPKDS